MVSVHLQKSFKSMAAKHKLNIFINQFKTLVWHKVLAYSFQEYLHNVEMDLNGRILMLIFLNSGILLGSDGCQQVFCQEQFFLLETQAERVLCISIVVSKHCKEKIPPVIATY